MFPWRPTHWFISQQVHSTLLIIHELWLKSITSHNQTDTKYHSSAQQNTLNEINSADVQMIRWCTQLPYQTRKPHVHFHMSANLGIWPLWVRFTLDLASVFLLWISTSAYVFACGVSWEVEVCIAYIWPQHYLNISLSLYLYQQIFYVKTLTKPFCIRCVFVWHLQLKIQSTNRCHIALVFHKWELAGAIEMSLDV